jgi:hypothetical protein
MGIQTMPPIAFSEEDEFFVLFSDYHSMPIWGSACRWITGGNEKIETETLAVLDKNENNISMMYEREFDRATIIQRTYEVSSGKLYLYAEHFRERHD